MSYVSLRWSALLIVYKHCVSAELLGLCCFAVLWGVFLVLLVFPVAVRPSLLLSCPPVPAELGAAHLLPLPCALGMAEPKGSVAAAVPVAAPGVRIYPVYPIYLCIAAGTRAGCAGTHPIADHTLLGRSKPCPVLPEILKCTNRHLVPGAGWCRSGLPGTIPGRSGGDSPGQSLRREVSDV